MSFLISVILEVINPLDTGKYLGLPSLIGSKKKTIFRYLRDRLWTRFQNWKGGSLSAAGRNVLLQAVAHAITSYCMNCFLLPRSVLDELQKMMNSFWWGSKSNGTRSIHWLSWDRLCVRKEFGGLGYRNMEGYNLAMLAKQGWKLISAPDALSSRLLKAKYFPKTDFLDARLGSHPSFIWRSIWCSQALWARGIRWKIGNGRSVNIGRDPWLRDPANFYLQTPLHTEQRSMMAHDLIDPQLRQWNLPRMQDMLHPRDVEEILKISVPATNSEDIRVWHFSQNGCYTVKSGYQLLMESITSSSNRYSVPGLWTQIWKILVPPKVRFFLWRVARNCLPCRQNLRHRGIDVPSCCALCGFFTENNWHLFIDCPYAQACWRSVKLLDFVIDCANNSDSCKQWLFRCLQTCSPQVIPTLAMTLWSLWKARNEKVWNEVDMPANLNVSLVSDMLHQWLAARKLPPVQPAETTMPTAASKWEKPPASFMKCNTDAALFMGIHQIGGAAIIRDENGEFMMGRSYHFQGLLEVREAEAKAMLDALTWTVSMDLQQIIFETDSKIVVDAIYSNLMDRSEFGTIIAECCSILSNEPTYKVQFVRRQANMVAHTLVRAANSYASPCVFSNVPIILTDALLFDCNNYS